METVREIMRKKGDIVVTLPSKGTIAEALSLFAEKNIGAIPIIEPTGRILGIISERDIIRRLALEKRLVLSEPVTSLMTKEVTCVREHQGIDVCMQLMTKKRVRHLPVVDEAGRLRGIISIGDVVKATISEHEILIDQLEHYITGGF